jgi:hypothetical protein
MKNRILVSTIMLWGSATVPVSVFALDCVKNDPLVSAYESGVDTGRKDAQQHKGNHAGKQVNHAHLSTRHQQRCFKKGYHIGYDNASADMPRQDSRQIKNPYEPGSNDYDYFTDGCMAGKKDGSANMSSVYQRYDNQYDSTYEQPFKKGYEACWQKYR